MAKYYDENGNPVEGVLTQAEADEAATQKIKDAETAAIEAYKKEHPEQVADPVAATELGTLKTQVETLTASLSKKEQDAAIAKYTGGDAEKETKVRAEFDKMSGYADPAARAEAAAKVALGEAKVVNVGDYSGAGNRNPDNNHNAVPLSRASDQALQKNLGLKPEDVAKYGPAIEAAEAAKTN